MRLKVVVFQFIEEPPTYTTPHKPNNKISIELSSTGSSFPTD